MHLLNLKFDCICLSEVWSTNLKSYQSIFQDYIPFFVDPIDNNVGRVAMFVKNDYKVFEMNELKIPYSSKVRVEDLWVEVTNNFGEKHMVSVIYRHQKVMSNYLLNILKNLCQKSKTIDPLSTA